MELLRNALLPQIPRRITQIYADTKSCYEQVVQTHVTNPQLSSLYLKLRIQKDRLAAWGLEWKDSNANQGDDIDDSLDRAGISDLVASIMSSIHELLYEADRIQPITHPRLPGGYPEEKAGSITTNNNPWSSAELARLADVVKDITTSIDTLCDLSRSQQAIRQEASGRSEQQSGIQKFMQSKLRDDQREASPAGRSDIMSRASTPPNASTVVNSTRIDPSLLRFPHAQNTAGPMPPSYDSIAATPGNRKFAFLVSSCLPSHTSRRQDYIPDIPVLVDYGYEFDSNVRQGKLPSLQRYEHLIRALQSSPLAENAYTGSLRILGWFADRKQCRFGFVYEIPILKPEKSMGSGSFNPPQTLLSYLQHSANTESANSPCLEDRFRLALNLVSNILHTHAKGLLHRNINSNNVVFITDKVIDGPESKPWKEGVIRKPFLVSWDQSSVDAVASTEETLMSSIYRHPSISRGQRSKFHAAHDIYSLGLVLLEIGVWMPIQKFWKSKYRGSDFKSRLQDVYGPRLAGKCGNSYMRVVEYCLRAADHPATSSPSSPQASRDNLQVNRQTDFYWNALKPLERCCMIDESNEPILVPSPSANGPDSETSEPKLLTDQAGRETQTPAVTSNGQPRVDSEQKYPEEQYKIDSPTQPGLQDDLLVWSHHVPKQTKLYFEQVMMPKLSKMLAKAIDRWESYQIDIFMAGDTPESARPTLLMVCKSIRMAWKILQYVNEDKRMFEIKVAVGQIHYSKHGKRRHAKNRRMGVFKSPDDLSSIDSSPSHYQQKPACGASIGAFVDERHLEAVTFGGIVLVDGQPFGMSVHHMLEDQDIDQGLDYVLESDESSSSYNVGSVPDDRVQGGIFPYVDPSEAQYSQGGDIDAEFDVRIFDREDDSDGECFNLGDTLGTAPGKGRELVVTQPALDDVDPAFFPNEEDMSDEHLTSHGLGYIHASSGLKQVKHGETKYEVDWALFKVCEGRLDSNNKIEGGEKYCGQTTSHYTRQVLKADSLGDLDVHAIGSKSGLAGGKISSTMVMTKMPGRVFATPVWRFKGDFGVGGDSGAWVVDNATGAVCGHVTAWSDFHKNGTISPMEVMLDDMERTLGKSVALPSTGSPQSPSSYRDQVIHPPNINDIEDDARNALAKSISREVSFDSDYGSETDVENLNLTLVDTLVEGHSPAIATSPPPPSNDMATLNLNHMTEEWTRAQDKRNSLEAGMEGGRNLGETMQLVGS